MFFRGMMEKHQTHHFVYGSLLLIFLIFIFVLLSSSLGNNITSATTGFDQYISCVEYEEEGKGITDKAVCCDLIKDLSCYGLDGRALIRYDEVLSFQADYFCIDNSVKIYLNQQSYQECVS